MGSSSYSMASADVNNELVPMKNMILLCHYPNLAPLSSPKLLDILKDCNCVYNKKKLEKDCRCNCYKDVNFDNFDVRDTLKVVDCDYVTDLKSWVDSNSSKIWDESCNQVPTGCKLSDEAQEVISGMIRLSNEAQMVIRAMIRVVYDLWKVKNRFHGALHHLENWSMRRVRRVRRVPPQETKKNDVPPQETKKYDEIEEFEVGFVLLNKNMNGKVSSIIGEKYRFYDLIKEILKDSRIQDHRADLKDLKDLLKYLHPWELFESSDLQLILNHPALCDWRSRRMYILNAVFYLNSLSLKADEGTQFKSRIQKISTAKWKEWRTKWETNGSPYTFSPISPETSLRRVYHYKNRKYNDNGFELLRFHRNVFIHIHEKTKPKNSESKTKPEDNAYWDLKFVEYILSCFFEDFLTDLYKCFHKQYSIEEIVQVI